MNRFPILATLTVLLISSCGTKKEATITPPPPPPAPTTTASPFTPNDNGQLSGLQLKFWDLSNKGLDSIATIYSEQLSTKDTAAYQASVVNYLAERDKHCKSSGISGGHDEYLWISKNIHNPINQPLLDSLKLQGL